MLIKRKIWAEIEKWMKEREIIIIKGPRQSGKTTTLKYLQSKYSGVYLTLEDDEVRNAIKRNPKEFIQRHLKEKIIYLDEAQYIRDIGHILKMWYDLYNIKLVVSGSGSFDIKVEVGRYLVGRLVYFEILPLDFGEFIQFKSKELYKIWKKENEKIKSLLNGNKEKLCEIPFVEELKRYLTEFLTFGGFPRIVLENDVEKKKKLLKDLHQTYLERDILHFMGIKSIEKFSKATKILATNLGTDLNISNLSSISEISMITMKEYLEILKRTYIIRKVEPFHSNKKKTIVKRKRIYFVDIGLRNAIVNDFSNPLERVDAGRILENFVLNEIWGLNPKYYRTTTGAEVDFVTKVPIEVKSKGKPKRGFYNFMKKFNSKFGVVFWMDELKLVNNIYFIPIWEV